MTELASREWTNYLAEMESAESEHQNINEALSTASEMARREEYAAAYHAGTIATELHILIDSRHPDREMREKFHQLLMHRLEMAQRQRNSDEQARLAHAIERITEREDRATAAQAEETRLDEMLAEAAARLDKVRATQPKATKGAYTALVDESATAQGELLRVTEQLEATRRELDEAEQAGEATSSVDELEARLALSDEGNAPAAAEIKKVRQELDLARENISHLQSRMRGLEKLEAAAQTKLEQMEHLRKSVGTVLYKAEQAKAEKALIHTLLEVVPKLDALNDIRDKLNAVSPQDTGYGRARLKVHMPSLYATESLPATGNNLDLVD